MAGMMAKVKQLWQCGVKSHKKEFKLFRLRNSKVLSTRAPSLSFVLRISSNSHAAVLNISVSLERRCGKIVQALIDLCWKSQAQAEYVRKTPRITAVVHGPWVKGKCYILVAVLLFSPLSVYRLLMKVKTLTLLIQKPGTNHPKTR